MPKPNEKLMADNTGAQAANAKGTAPIDGGDKPETALAEQAEQKSPAKITINISGLPKKSAEDADEKPAGKLNLKIAAKPKQNKEDKQQRTNKDGDNETAEESDTDDCKGSSDGGKSDHEGQKKKSKGKNRPRWQDNTPRNEYPRTIAPIPPKPDYTLVEKETSRLEKEIAKKEEAHASIKQKIESLDSILRGQNLEGLDEATRTRFKEVQEAFTKIRKQRGEIMDELNEVKNQIREIVGSNKGAQNFKDIEARIADMKYEMEHTSLTVEEEKERRATIKKLSEKVKHLPRLLELEEKRNAISARLDEISKVFNPVKAEKEKMDALVKESMAKTNPDQLSTKDILTKLKEARQEATSIRDEIRKLVNKKYDVAKKYKSEMYAYTFEERRFEAQTKRRAFLRSKWARLCNMINWEGASIVEEGDESGEFVVSSFPVTEIPNRRNKDKYPSRGQRTDTDGSSSAAGASSEYSMRAIETAKQKLIKWCEAALKSSVFGTSTVIKTGKKSEVRRNKDLCNLLETLELEPQCVEDKEAVTKTLKFCRGEEEPEEVDQAALEAKKREEEKAQKAAEEEEKKQKRLAEINDKIRGFIREMIEFKATIRYA